MRINILGGISLLAKIKRKIEALTFSYGKNFSVYRNNKIFSPASITTGSKVSLFNCELDGEIHLGDNCLINNSIVRGRVSIGKSSALNGPTSFVLSKHNPISIGNYCSIAHNVSIVEFFHNTQTLSTSFLHKKLNKKSSTRDTWSKGPIRIGHDVWIGAGAVILSGVTIGNGAIIGANTVVNQDVPSYAIVAGSPSKVVKYRFEEAICEKLDELSWWNNGLKELKACEHLLQNQLNLEVLNEIESLLK
ncbi:MAG: CatB-related O-acetyltransferase [Candidatus Cloacimonetes bacterium]|nr:CatB-related O-acetyltransferase [Candidatus Cloacimonadota bacterium]